MFFGGLFAYDLVAGFERSSPVASDTACPDYCFYLAETLLVIDHQTSIPFRPACSPAGVKNNAPGAAPEPAASATERNRAAATGGFRGEMRCDVDQSDEEYGAVVRKMQRAIRAGEIFQVVPSRRFSPPAHRRWPLIRAEEGNPSPYMFFMQDNDFTLFERLAGKLAQV